MSIIRTFLRVVDKINTITAKIVAVAIPAIMCILTLEVILRYVFNNPTIWAMETSQLLMCTFIALGGGYTAIQGGHVNVDVIVGKLSGRTRAILDIVTAPLFFIFISLFLIKMVEIGWDSVANLETSGTYFDPPVYPIKILMALGVFLLLIQGLGKLIKDIQLALNRMTNELNEESSKQ